MRIYLSPQRRDDTLTVTKSGDVLTINGVEYDFTNVPEGGVLPQDAVDCMWLASDITRENGELTLTLLLPHKADATEAARFPQPLTNIPDGKVVLPE